MSINIPDGVSCVTLDGNKFLIKNPPDVSYPTGILFPNGDDPLAYAIYKFDLTALGSAVVLEHAEVGIVLPANLVGADAVVVARIGVYRLFNGVRAWSFADPVVNADLAAIKLTTANDRDNTGFVHVIVMCDLVPTGPGKLDLPLPLPSAEVVTVKVCYSSSASTPT